MAAAKNRSARLLLPMIVPGRTTGARAFLAGPATDAKVIFFFAASDEGAK
jgi:hypothetical protein